jgi:hypothetical protein
MASSVMKGPRTQTRRKPSARLENKDDTTAGGGTVGDAQCSLDRL